MTDRRFSPSRFYKFSKVIVLIMTAIAVLVTLYTGFMSGFGTDVLLHRWENYCSLHPDNPETMKLTGLTCMSIGLEQVNQFNDLCWKALLVAISLPSIFFGGTALYRYLFPKQK